MLDYHNEPHGVYLMIDNKSFFASIESVQRGIDPLDSVLLVMAEHENNGSGLVVATSPLAKKHFGIRNVDRRRCCREFVTTTHCTIPCVNFSSVSGSA